MATKIRFLGNIGEHNPKQNNIMVGMIQDATVPSLNGRLIAFAVRSNVTTGSTGLGLDLAIQPQKFISDAVLINKTSTFPQSLIGDLLTFEQFQSLGITSEAPNYDGTRIALSAFVNDISALKFGYQAVGLGEIRGGGVTATEMEELLDYDINDDGVIGAINNLKNKLDKGNNTPPPAGYLDGLKDTLNGIHPQAWNVVKWGAIGVGANIATKLVVGKPLVGKGGLVVNTK
ncbi:hypothetical protein [Emticicia sp. 17c]|uniref:hypothetical protein n=1 Tax=Emticicia sp. 17c TaxID=3127704 RepID=UPI00301E2061